MGRAQFEYDEVGNTFYYVVVSFYAVILIPLTYVLWPFINKIVEQTKHIGCQCEGDVAKHAKKSAVKPWERTKKILKGIVLVILWGIFLFLVYKIRQIEHVFIEYDPYKILQIDVDADVSEIKRKYRELSKLHHPDKGGEAETFDEIVKAYKALTDDEARENWRLYGNPDGPKATTFGIALPKWIVSEQYGNWVLGIYVALFMVILPLFVGLWWYNTMKYSADKVLLDTTRLYFYFLQKTPSMEVNRILMVVAGSFEFWRKFNPSIVERESDDIEIPRVMKELRNLGENKKEPPLCHPWSLKARTLVHAYLSRIELQSDRLEIDQEYIVGRLLLLLEEFLRVLLQMMLQIPMQRPPTIDTLENALKLFPMCVQGIWPRNSSLMQLPHIKDQNIAYLRKNRVITCQDMARLPEFRRRSLLNQVSSEQYDDIIYVLSMMPKLEIETKIEVQGEDDKETVTVGSVVTLKVILRRAPLLDLEKRKQETIEQQHAKQTVNKDYEDPQQKIDDEQQLSTVNKRKIWEKPPKKKQKGKGGKGSQKPALKKQPNKPQQVESAKHEASAESQQSPSQRKPEKKQRNEDASDNDDESESLVDSAEKNDGVDSNTDEEDDSGTKSKKDTAGTEELSSNDVDDDFNWDDTDLAKKETLLESEPVNHHEVHCPYYPGDKFEWWYIYLVDRKSRRLVSMVVPCKTLNVEKTIELRFSAPPIKGTYYFILNVRSDSYMEFDYSTDLKMEVYPAREPIQVKYEETEEEDEGKDDDSSGSSRDYTEGSDSEDDG